MGYHQRSIKGSRIRNYYKATTVLILLSLLGLRVYISQTSGLMYDEPVTLHLAEQVSLGKLPYQDFYEHHSLLPWYILAPLSQISVWQVQRLLIGIAGAFAVLGLTWLIAKQWGARAGLIAAVLGLVSPLWQHQGTMIIHDSFLVVGLVASILLWWYASQRSSLWLWLIAGGGAGVLLHCKQTGILPALGLGIGVLLYSRSVRVVLTYLLGALITFIPLVILYWGQWGLLYQGYLGWNIAANSYLPANPKFTPFFNDIFWANPLLWGAGITAALMSLRYIRKRFEPGDAHPVLLISGLTVIFILTFNWFLSKQTFGQYYLQAVPALILLGSHALNSMIEQPFPQAGRIIIAVILVYLGVINPFVNALVPWTPDLDEKLQISTWVQEEIGDELIWEPWVYYAHLAGKDFSFYYPFLSIHSLKDGEELLSIDGKDEILLKEFLEKNEIRWIVLHQPLMPGLKKYLDRMLTAGMEDWQLVKFFRVKRYASESGLQRRLWTPWWEPLTFYENVMIWYKHPEARSGGIVGTLRLQNPSGSRNVYLEVQHPGGVDIYQLDENSRMGQDYLLNWHQTGHAFFLSEGPYQIGHQNQPEEPNRLTFSVAFSDQLFEDSQDIYRIEIPRKQDGEYCIDCLESQACRLGEVKNLICVNEEIQDVIDLQAIVYESIEDVSIGH